MRRLAGLILCLSIAVPAARGANGAMTPAQVFAAVSPSIVVVEAFDKDGHALAQGSGVVIAKGVVVSNCHVFEEDGFASASVFYREKSYSAELRYADIERDLCSFTVKGLSAPAVRMGATSALKVGDPAYAIGAPEGLDLTLSNGLISGLRPIPGGVVIQTSAPISPGSSGGGLFDAQGRLIGITSYYEKEGQQLNFALPVEWIAALPQHGKTPQALAAQSEATNADFLKGLNAERNGDYATARSIFTPLAEHGDAYAQLQMGWMYDNGLGMPQDYAKAAYWYGKAAAQGEVDAQYNLGLVYYNGQGVPQDYAKAAYWARKAAEQGDARAQAAIGDLYRSGQGVPQDYAQALYWYGKAAAQGDARAQADLGAMYTIGLGTPKNYTKAAYWRGKAAEQGIPEAQAALGALYLTGLGVPQDYVQAAKWLILAQAEGSKDAGAVLTTVENRMTPAQIAEAQRLANQWWEAHHQ